ncbi:MAG: uL30 family ribosomal protein [Nanoarchaeota archaeon]|nr:uL30 family ribosomal protein [Nanoarchaeota archaeon]
MEQEKKTQKEPKKAEPAKAPAKEPAASGNVAVILIRNTTGASWALRDTLKMLNLHTKFSCSLFKKSGSILGMLKKAKGYITYGEIDGETEKLLEQKRAKKGSEKKAKMSYNLHPPRGGFERKGIKKSYAQGGVLGYRGARINELIKKMI